MHTENTPQPPAAATSPTPDAAKPAAAEPVTKKQAAARKTTAPTTAAKKPTTKKPPAKTAPAKKPISQPATSSKPKGKSTKPAAPTAPKTPDPKGKAEPVAAAAQKPGRAPREGSTMWAIRQVLADASGPLGTQEIYARILEQDLATGLKGKTPEQTVAAALAVAAKKGQYVKRTAPGKFQAIEARS